MSRRGSTTTARPVVSSPIRYDAVGQAPEVVLSEDHLPCSSVAGLVTRELPEPLHDPVLQWPGLCERRAVGLGAGQYFIGRGA